MMCDKYDPGRGGGMEALRRELMDEACAGACSGFGAMLLDADEIRRELEKIARRYGR